MMSRVVAWAATSAEDAVITAAQIDQIRVLAAVRMLSGLRRQSLDRCAQLAVRHVGGWLVEKSAAQVGEVFAFGLAVRQRAVEQRAARGNRDDHLGPERLVDRERRT